MKLHDTYDPKCFALAVAFLADEAWFANCGRGSSR